MEEQINDLNINITTSMMIIAFFCSFAVQFIKVVLKRFTFFSSDEIKKSFFPMLSIALTAGALFIAGVEDWMIAGVILGWSACGGYTSLSGSAGLIKKSPVLPVISILLLFTILGVGCSQVQMSPAYRQNLEMTNVVVQSLNDDCQAGDPNACSKGLAESAEILQLLVDAVHGTPPKGGQR